MLEPIALDYSRALPEPSLIREGMLRNGFYSQQMIQCNSMKQSDGYNKDFTDKTDTVSKNKSEKMEDWRNEHGQPSFKYIQSLAADGSPAALEKLRSIAADLDVGYDPDTPIKELIEKIRSATEDDPNATT
jgi:hypothetical protein